MSSIHDVRQRIAEVNVRSDIYDVRVTHLQAQAVGPEVQPGPYTVSAQVQTAQHQIDDELRVVARYELTAERADDDGEPIVDGEVWRVELELVASFRVVIPGHSFTEDELADFAAATGIMAIHPYAREAVQSTVSRLGYPPYTMEFMRSAWDGDELEDLDVGAETDDPHEANSQS